MLIKKEKEKVNDKQQIIDWPKKGQSSKKEWKLWNSFPVIFLDSAKLRLCFEEFFFALPALKQFTCT